MSETNTPVTGEKLSDAEYKVQQLMAIAEADLMSHGNGYPGRSGGEGVTDLCGEASLTVRYYGRQNDLDVRLYQIKDVHDYFCGGNALESGVWNQTFAHGFNVAVIDDEPFLVDLTFGQFCSGDTVKQGKIRDTYIPTDHPLVAKLILDGYASLTDETLFQYMQLTSCTMDADRDYIEDATVEMLLHDVPLVDMQFMEEDIVSGEIWHLRWEAWHMGAKMPNTCTSQERPCPRPDPTITSLGSTALR